MHYRNGVEFQLRVLGPHLEGYRNYASFSECVVSLIGQNSLVHPNTRVGELVYHGVKAKLEKAGVDTSGLVLINSVAKSIDYHHQTDAFFFLPTSSSVATVDLFNMDSNICRSLRYYWDLNAPYSYGESEFQGDLYSYKKNKGADSLLWCEKMFSAPKEGVFRPRPENHFILTPYHTEFRENRGRFCSLVASFLIKPSKKGKKIT